MRAKLREVAEAANLDPKLALLDALEGCADGLDVFHNNVLVATYIGPDRTPGGIIRADRTLAEDRFQGKAALVLKVGPLAFVDDPKAGITFGGKKIAAGDWVLTRPSDGAELFVSDKSRRTGVPCRIFKDVDIMARLDDPALIY